MGTQEAVKESRPVNQVYNMEQGVGVTNFIDVDIDGEVKSFQIVIRNGMSAQQAVAQTEVSIEAYRVLRAKFPRPNGKEVFVPNKSPEKPAESFPDKVEHPDKPKRDYTKPVPQNELPPELNGTTVDVFIQDFDEIEIQPQLDEKVSVKFLKDGLKWPVGAPINKWKHEQVIKALEPLGEFDVTKPAKIRVAGEQYWAEGNAYKDQQGIERHYKNLKLVQATL